MAGPARTITPVPRRNASQAPARTLADLGNHSSRQGAERDMLLTAALNGKLNTTGDVTLATGGATTTDISDPRIGTNTVAILVPLDGNAAASMTTVSQSVTAPGTIQLAHAASALTRAFKFILIGLAALMAATSAWAASPSLIGIPQSSDPTCNTGEYYLSVLTTGTKWRKCENGVWSDIGSGAGAGEANTASNLGGGLANWDSKSGVDLRFNSFASADFDLASNLITIDATKWLTIAAGAAAYQPLDSDLTSIAALSTTATGRGLLDDTDAAAIRSTAAAAPASPNYLVGTTNSELTNNIPVGTSPGGELGGTWASPTIDNGVSVDGWTISGSPTIDLTASVGPAPVLEGRIEWDSAEDHLIVGAAGAYVEFVPTEDFYGDAIVGPDGLVTVADDSHAHGGAKQSVTLGPFYINDLPGTATTQATLGYFNTATAVSRNTNDVRIQASGRVTGIFITSDAARTAGTATARVRIAGTGTTFNSGAVALDATNTTSDSSMVLHSVGNAVSSGQTIGCDVVTSGWTPTTADISCWVVVSLD